MCSEYPPTTYYGVLQTRTRKGEAEEGAAIAKGCKREPNASFESDARFVKEEARDRRELLRREDGRFAIAVSARGVRDRNFNSFGKGRVWKRKNAFLSFITS